MCWLIEVIRFRMPGCMQPKVRVWGSVFSGKGLIHSVYEISWRHCLLHNKSIYTVLIFHDLEPGGGYAYCKISTIFLLCFSVSEKVYKYPRPLQMDMPFELYVATFWQKKYSSYCLQVDLWHTPCFESFIGNGWESYGRKIMPSLSNRNIRSGVWRLLQQECFHCEI